MRFDQLLEFGACLIGHSIWVGLLVVFTYWLLVQTSSKLTASAKVWIGLFFLSIVPFVSILVSVKGAYQLPFSYRVPVSISPKLVSALVVIWGLGILIYLSRYLFGLIQINSIVKAGRVEPDSAFASLVGEFRKRFAISNRPSIEVNSRVSAPFLIGIVSPRVVLPEAMRKVDSNCLDCVMVHELAHFFRKDTSFLMIQKLLETIFFYHPALRWLSREIRSEREKACDDLSVAMLGGNRLGYASALLEAENVATSRFPLALSFGSESTADRANRIAFGTWSETVRPGNALLATLLFLTMIVGGWSVLSLVEVRFSLAKTAPQVAGDSGNSIISVGPIPTIDWSKKAWLQAHWEDRVVGGRKVPVFRSVPLIEKGGEIIDLTNEKPRLFPEVPNSWLLQYRIDYLDSGMLSKDHDGDLFTTLEEYEAGTSPDRGNSHPDRVELMSFYGLNYQAYRIQYRANPDHKTVQLTRMRSAQHPDQQNFYLKAGETTRDGRVRLENISQEWVTIRDVKSGRRFALKKKESAELRTNYAALKIRGGTIFYEEEGASFYIPGDTSKKWTLSRVTEETCQLQGPGEERRILSRK